MGKEIVINCESVTKSYKLFERPVDRVKETFHPFRKKYHHIFNALENVSFTVRKGESIGFIGKNGSGKSTLLQIVSGILKPSSGIVNVSGKISALLELGAGFNPEFTGRQNVYLNASILGLKKKETDRIFNDIVEFAEIGNFMDQAVKTYSSGMRMRLAFAVQSSVDPGIMIVDEVLAVGDLRFSMKCLRKMNELKKKGTAFLFVSHDMASVINFCDEVLWLNNGKIMQRGDPKKITMNYSNFMTYGFLPPKDTAYSRGTDDPDEEIGACMQCEAIVRPICDKHSEHSSCYPQHWVDVSDLPATGTGRADIKRVALIVSNHESNITFLEGGEQIELFMEIVSYVDLKNPIICADFRDTKGNLLFGLNTYFLNQNAYELEANRLTIVSFTFQTPLLGNGDYSLSLAIADGSYDSHIQHHIINEALLLKMRSADPKRKHYLVSVENTVFNILNTKPI